MSSPALVPWRGGDDHDGGPRSAARLDKLGLPFHVKASYRKANRSHWFVFRIGDENALAVLADVKARLDVASSRTFTS